MAMVGGILDLERAIDAVQSVDARELSDDVLVETVVALDRELQRLAAEHARLAAAVDASKAYAADGSKSAAARLSRECRRPRAACARAVRLGRAMRGMSAVGDALAAGEIAVEHAEELARCRLVAPEAFEDDEAMLVDFARTLRFDDFLKACAYWRQVVDPDGVDRDADRAVHDRYLRWHKRHDGSVLGEFQLAPVAGAAFTEAIERIEQQFFRGDWAEAKAERGDGVRTSDLARTPRQRRADALVEMAYRANTAPADGRRPEPLVTVYVDYETLATRLCELSDGTVVAPGQIVPLLDRADLERIVFGPTNRVIALSERARFFTGGLRRAIQLRDRRCQWPGCDTPAARCDIDHEIAYVDGGRTVQENGRCFCERHNQFQERRRSLRQSKRQHRSQPRATTGPAPP